MRVFIKKLHANLSFNVFIKYCLSSSIAKAIPTSSMQFETINFLFLKKKKNFIHNLHLISGNDVFVTFFLFPTLPTIYSASKSFVIPIATQNWNELYNTVPRKDKNILCFLFFFFFSFIFYFNEFN